jgi:hypothetical protein
MLVQFTHQRYSTADCDANFAEKQWVGVKRIFLKEILCKFPEMVHTGWISINHSHQFSYYRMANVAAGLW